MVALIFTAAYATYGSAGLFNSIPGNVCYIPDMSKRKLE
jgi:hypothetical protein